MATATATIPTTTAATAIEMQPTIVVKRPGPPVPPRPKTTATIAAATSATYPTATAATSPTTTPPIIQKKPTFVSQLSAVGRTLVYKSPALQLPKKQAQTQTPTMALVATATATVAAAAPATAPKPPLKLRKAPDVPTAKPRETVGINRANSLSAQSTPRLSLDKIAALQPTTQPLPKPRKIVQMPVATLDMDELQVAVATTPANSIFRRSKTTLDSPINGGARGGAGSVGGAAGGRGGSGGSGGRAAAGGGGAGSYLGGKTVELKNNLKNAAERLFSEIIISQSQKQSLADTTIITKHERAIQHQALLEQELEQERHKRTAQLRKMHAEQQLNLQAEQSEQQVTIQAAGNCTRINIKPSNGQTNPSKISLSAGNTPEKKKDAFHELLISELAAMRNRSCSLEQLSSNALNKATPTKTNLTRQRYNSIDDADTEDVDADNVEDADGDEEDNTLSYAINKSLKEQNNLNGSSTPTRKRCPSGCSSDSSPYGTERSQRIRTSDWIEVGDNGKQVTLTSCHISLEDSGMEDEERLDDMSSSGVGDSWDSVKEAENEKRCRNVKRGMSLSGLPPLPKSLSGFNKLLGSDSGLLSDVEAQQELESSSNNSNNNNNKENESGNKLASQKVSDNKSNNKSNSNSNNNNNNNDKQATKDSNNKDNANDKSVPTSVDSEKKTTATTAASATSNANENENKTKATTIITTTTTIATTTATTTATNSPAKINVTGSTLDAQIATLRKEMYGLRQLDLSLLSQLWALNDSIQEFRTMIEEQDDEEDDEDDGDLDEQGNRRHSPTPSSYDSVSSEGGAEADLVMLQAKAKRLGTIPKVITTQPKQQAKSDNIKPVPRMRSAPPPPPPTALLCTARKAAAPPRPT